MWSGEDQTTTITTRTYSSNSSSSSTHQTTPRGGPRTMEDVWKDITLVTPTPTNHPSMGGVILQDFLTPVRKEKIITTTSAPIQPPLAPPPLSLNFLDSVEKTSGVRASPAPFMEQVGFEAFCENNREGKGDGDRRHKRMMKNRESAARSRARKQAYTIELEVEVANLGKENARLRRQHEELRLAMAARSQTKEKLHRTLTAPF